MDPGNAENPVYIDSKSGESVYGSTHGGSQDSTTPRASRCPSPPMKSHDKTVENPLRSTKKEGGDGFDPEKMPSMDEIMDDADSQYETDTDSQCDVKEKTTHRDRVYFPPLKQEKKPVEGFTDTQGDAIRKAMRANRVLKSGARAIATPVRSHTRGQNDVASKQSVRELADEVKDLKTVVTNFFAAMGRKEEVEEGRWVGFHRAWMKADEKWSDILHHIMSVHDIEWIDEGKSNEKGEAIEREGPDWFDRVGKAINALRNRDERNTSLLERIIKDQAHDSGIQFRGAKEGGVSSKAARQEAKGQSELLEKILREIKNVKGQQDKMREEVCKRQNNFESELSKIRQAIEEAANQEELSRRRQTPDKGRARQTPPRQGTAVHTIPPAFAARMELIETPDEASDPVQTDNGGRLIYIDEIGTYNYPS